MSARVAGHVTTEQLDGSTRSASTRGTQVDVEGRRRPQRSSRSSSANPIATLAHDGEPGRSMERHRGVVCGRRRDGDRARTPMGESRAPAHHGIASMAVPPMVRMGANRLEQAAPTHTCEPPGRGGRGLPAGVAPPHVSGMDAAAQGIDWRPLARAAPGRFRQGLGGAARVRAWTLMPTSLTTPGWQPAALARHYPSWSRRRVR
jgi:hypothetical protein